MGYIPFWNALCRSSPRAVAGLVMAPESSSLFSAKQWPPAVTREQPSELWLHLALPWCGTLVKSFFNIKVTDPMFVCYSMASHIPGRRRRLLLPTTTQPRTPLQTTVSIYFYEEPPRGNMSTISTNTGRDPSRCLLTGCSYIASPRHLCIRSVGFRLIITL